MRTALIVLAPLALAGAALAQPPGEDPPTKAVQCIDVSGNQLPADCRAQASRLDPREDICTCPNAGTRVEVAVCAKGQRPPPEGRALNTARREAIRDGSLIGDTFEGQPICVAPRQP